MQRKPPLGDTDAARKKDIFRASVERACDVVVLIDG